jgi:hypothetical protein
MRSPDEPGIRAHGLQPRFFPENQAIHLAATVGTSITTRFEMNRPIDAAAPNWKNSVASLMRPFIDREPLSAESEHLRHEWHPVELPLTVESAQNFLSAADLYPVADFQLSLQTHAPPNRSN